MILRLPGGLWVQLVVRRPDAVYDLAQSLSEIAFKRPEPSGRAGVFDVTDVA
jgi:hypothetical protein